MELPIEMQIALARMQVAHHERMDAAIRAAPTKHKCTLQWPKDSSGPSWRYFDGGLDRCGVRRRFCWTTNRNSAGYFLSFVEVWNSKKGRGERKDFIASKTRHLMKARARRMWDAYRNRGKRKA
jgi:hypothetical protein